MKNIFRISIYLVLCAAVMVGCQEDETDNVSFVTTYPVITLSGPSLYATPLGTAFSDPGVAAFVGTNEVTVVTSGEVDVTAPGVYALTYQATNADGFSRTASRQVIVYDPATNAVDLSGQYRRAATGAVATVTKIGPSTYTINDAGGFGGDPYLDVTFVHTSGTNLVIPQQTATSGITVSSIPGSAFTTATGFRWQLSASSFYGTAVRTFVKL
jgi:hypothetical protein